MQGLARDFDMSETVFFRHQIYFHSESLDKFGMENYHLRIAFQGITMAIYKY